jgi:hypothetical protein
MQNVVVLFNSKEFTAPMYDKAWEDLRSEGFSNPKGLLSHVAYVNADGAMDVVDVWESADAFAEFGKALGPIMQKSGVNLPEPKIIPAHNFYQVQAELA